MGWLILGAVLLTVSMTAVIVLGRFVPRATVLVFQPGVRRADMPLPRRMAPPPQRLAVSLWEPQPVKGELER